MDRGDYDASEEDEYLTVSWSQLPDYMKKELNMAMWRRGEGDADDELSPDYYGESKASEVQVKPTNDYFNFEDRGTDDGIMDATCQICGETLTTGFGHDLYDHMVENHNDVFRGIASEGGFGSGKRGHSSWMKDIEFGGNYKKCPLCNINTNFTNGKCEICGNSFAGEKKKANEYGDPLVGSWDEGGWFFGIPNMTRDDYEGGVYWKGKRVEHFDHDYFGYNDDNDDWVNKMREDAKKLERKILELEAKNIPVNMTTVLG